MRKQVGLCPGIILWQHCLNTRWMHCIVHFIFSTQQINALQKVEKKEWVKIAKFILIKKVQPLGIA